MTYAEAKQYVKKNPKWRLVDPAEIQDIACVENEWSLVDKVRVYDRNHERHHELFPEQEYPTIFKKVGNEVLIAEGSPHALYRVILRGNMVYNHAPTRQVAK